MAKENTPATASVLDIAVGTLIESENIQKYKKVEETMTLQKLMDKKLETENTIKSLIGILLGNGPVTLDKLKSTVAK